MVSPMIFLDFCKNGADSIRIIKNAIPNGAKYVRSFTNDSSGLGNIGLVIESESFDEVGEGELIPILPYPTFEKVYVNNI